MGIKCLRCGHDLTSYGERSFQKTNRWEWIGSIGELFEREFRVEVYACSLCGHLEFFNPAVGGERRRSAE